MGSTILWKRFTIELSQVRPGQTVLDLAGGSGDLTRLLAKKVGETGQVILADINAAMLNVGRDRLLDEGLYKILILFKAMPNAYPLRIIVFIVLPWVLA